VLEIFLSVLVSVWVILGVSYVFYRFEWKGLFVFLPPLLLILFNYTLAADVLNLMNPLFIGAAGGIVVKKNRGFSLYLTAASAISALILTGTYYYLVHVKGIDIMEMSKAEMAGIIAAGGAPDDIKSEINANLDEWLKTAMNLVPFISFFYSVLFASAAWGIIRVFLKRMFPDSAAAGLELFRLNDYIIFVLISGLAAVLIFDSETDTLLHAAGLNVLLAATLLYAVQALGVIKFFLLKKGLPRYLLPLGIAGFLIAGPGAIVFAYIIFSGIGALDMWADFRKLDIVNNNITTKR
jgi:hypothetical protein